MAIGVKLEGRSIRERYTGETVGSGFDQIAFVDMVASDRMKDGAAAQRNRTIPELNFANGNGATDSPERLAQPSLSRT